MTATLTPTNETLYATEVLVTDTRAYDVVKMTAKTVTVRPRVRGEVVYSDGAPFPVVYNETVESPEAPTRVVRERKDGTYRMGAGCNALMFTSVPPTTRTDYSF